MNSECCSAPLDEGRCIACGLHWAFFQDEERTEKEDE